MVAYYEHIREYSQNPDETDCFIGLFDFKSVSSRNEMFK